MSITFWGTNAENISCFKRRYLGQKIWDRAKNANFPPVLWIRWFRNRIKVFYAASGSRPRLLVSKNWKKLQKKPPILLFSILLETLLWEILVFLDLVTDSKSGSSTQLRQDPQHNFTPPRINLMNLKKTCRDVARWFWQARHTRVYSSGSVSLPPVQPSCPRREMWREFIRRIRQKRILLSVFFFLIWYGSLPLCMRKLFITDQDQPQKLLQLQEEVLEESFLSFFCFFICYGCYRE